METEFVVGTITSTLPSPFISATLVLPVTVPPAPKLVRSAKLGVGPTPVALNSFSANCLSGAKASFPDTWTGMLISLDPAGTRRSPLAAV